MADELNETETGHAEHTAKARAAGAGAGAAGGALAGAAGGTFVAGPIGTIVGAIAGALGGGWVGLEAGKETHYTDAHDAQYRAHYESSPHRLADRGFDAVRPGYQLGHLAARNPDYRGRDFSLIEPDLQRAWSGELATKHGDWQTIRPWVQAAYVGAGPTLVATDAAQSQVVVGDWSDPATVPDSPVQGVTFAEVDMGGTESHQRASFSDPIPPGDPDRVSGEREIPGREE